MRYFLYLTILFLFISNFARSQDSIKNSISAQFGMTRLDFFTGVRFARTYKKWVPFSSAEIGINRTIFQSRFYPKVGIGCSYFCLNKNKFKVGPQLSFAHSLLKVNSTSSHFNQWNEVFIGTRIEIGSKIRFPIEVNGGLLNERFYNQISNKKEGVNSLGFNANIGVMYVW